MPIIVTTSSSTAQDLIDRAMRQIQQLESGESATAAETADCLRALNAMLDSWRNERLMCFSLQDEVITLAATTTVLSIGPSGTYTTTRPQDIISAHAVLDSIARDIRVISSDEWDAIPDKTSTSDVPYRLYYEPQMPNGFAYLYPIPSSASELHIRTKVPLTGYLNATDTIELPPGWEEAVVTNLAVAIAPEFETEAKPSVVKRAAMSKASIKTVNSRPIEARTELGAMFRRGRPNILTGEQ